MLIVLLVNLLLSTPLCETFFLGLPGARRIVCNPRCGGSSSEVVRLL